MKSVLDIGRQGADRLGDYAQPQAKTASSELLAMIKIVKQFPTQTVQAETAGGIKRPVPVYPLLLANRSVFGLVHQLAAYEPMAYAQQGQRRVLGMLSPNYDSQSGLRLRSVKVIPLAQAYPLTDGLLPDARMATMLAGAVNAETRGVGTHSLNTADDFEHKATILGAVSLRDSTVATGDKNHDVRASSSLATGLSNGALGRLYVPDGSLDTFAGYGEPMIFNDTHVAATDAIFLPQSFLDSTEGFGGHYEDASRIMMGAALQVLLQRDGEGILSEVNRIGAAVNSELLG